MITDAQSQGDLIAALQYEALFNSGHRGSLTDSNRVAYVKPAIRGPNEHDVVRPRHRLAFGKRLAVNAQGSSIETDLPEAESIENGSTAASRAAANVAAWRAYLPEDCVAAMIRDGWHRST
jgi:hypothetical protein